VIFEELFRVSRSGSRAVAHQCAGVKLVLTQDVSVQFMEGAGMTILDKMTQSE